MAKNDKPTRKSKNEDKSKKDEGPQFTVDDIVEATGLQPASVRVGLRESDFKKTGRQWGWNTKKDFAEVLKFFKERAAKQPDTGKEKAATKDKPKRRSKK